MKCLRITALFLLVALPAAVAADDGAKPASAKLPHMSKQTRMEIVRTFNAELVYARSPFPMGKTGLKLKNGQLTPGGSELQQMIAMWGPAVKPGDQARITEVTIKDDHIRFEINGGPVKKQKWYQRITISGSGGSATPAAPSDAQANPRGSYVDLYFDHYVPELTGPQLKDLLRPVFDFNAKSAVEAYLETVPPKVKEAIKSHQVLVGMNREMVMYSKGRPPKKIREKAGETEYEDWIYGEPPQDVEFVRLVGDEVTRVEIMKVNGEKTLRTEKEVDIRKPAETQAKKEEPGQRPANAPTLRRPGEDLPNASPTSMPGSPPPVPPVDIPTAPSGGQSPSGSPPPSSTPITN
ncbi:MAG TPA: hypothetical protein VFJ47_14130 [Terriglobales bacterium]|nr:hypothetical protein [Terriglobales bacterium]